MSNEIMSNVDEQVPLEDYILKYASQIPVRVQIDGRKEKKMTTYELIAEMPDTLKARLDRADASDCYIDESGDIVIVDDSTLSDQEKSALRSRIG